VFEQLFLRDGFANRAIGQVKVANEYMHENHSSVPKAIEHASPQALLLQISRFPSPPFTVGLPGSMGRNSFTTREPLN
jgi:hypothetical protein